MTSVYPITIFDYPHWCLGVLAMDPIAEGTVDLIQTDNDLFSYLYDHNRVNAYGWSAHGVLFDPFDDESMIFNGGVRCVWGGYTEDPDEVFRGDHCKEKIVLK